MSSLQRIDPLLNCDRVSTASLFGEHGSSLSAAKDKLCVLMVIRIRGTRRTDHGQRLVAVTARQPVRIVDKRHRTAGEPEMHLHEPAGRIALLDGVNRIRQFADQPQHEIKVSQEWVIQ